MNQLAAIGISLVFCGAAGAVSATTGVAQTPGTAETRPEPQLEKPADVIELDEKSAPPVYVPPRRGAPKTRVGGGTRAGGDNVQVALLAPEHTGLTGQAAPSLYWWLSAPHSGPFEVVLTDRQSVSPLLRFRHQGPLEAGVHRIDLAAHGVSLTPGLLYQWSVAIIADEQRRSHDIVSVATLERVALTAAGDNPNALAEAGLWYDAIDLISKEDAMAEAGAAERRAGLLDQVALTPIARWDRTGS